VVDFVDPAWREGLDLFARCYEPRSISFEALSAARVKMRAPDLYEFLTTYTWGPDSFPYEIREQRAVMSRADWVRELVAACTAADPERPAKEVPVPDGLASYLQPGYPEHLRAHVRLFDESGTKEVPMPDVTGVWVIEKG
jgi:hypothetical protein